MRNVYRNEAVWQVLYAIIKWSVCGFFPSSNNEVIASDLIEIAYFNLRGIVHIAHLWHKLPWNSIVRLCKTKKAHFERK